MHFYLIRVHCRCTVCSWQHYCEAICKVTCAAIPLPLHSLSLSFSLSLTHSLTLFLILSFSHSLSPPPPFFYLFPFFLFTLSPLCCRCTCPPPHQSVVLITRLPYVTFYSQVIQKIAPEYFTNGIPSLEAGTYATWLQ